MPTVMGDSEFVELQMEYLEEEREREKIEVTFLMFAVWESC